MEEIANGPVSHSLQISLLSPANPVHKGEILEKVLHHPLSIFFR